MAKQVVYNKFTEDMTTVFTAAVVMANKLNRSLESQEEKIRNYIGIAQAIAQAGVIQVDLMNDKTLANIYRNCMESAEVENATEAMKEAKADKAETQIAKEGKATKDAMKAAADKKMAEIKERKEAEAAAKTVEEKPAAPTPQEAKQAKEEAPAPAQAEEAVKQAVESASEPDMEWNAATLEKYASEINTVKQLVEAFGQKTANQLVAQYTSNEYTATDQLLPANIKGFVAYIMELQAQAQSQQMAS